MRSRHRSKYDPWGYEYRNCTSYVAWRLASGGVNASLFRDLGNANQWLGAVAGETGVVVNDTPSPGSVAVWNTGPYGHVVTSVPTAYIHFSPGPVPGRAH